MSELDDAFDQANEDIFDEIADSSTLTDADATLSYTRSVVIDKDVEAIADGMLQVYGVVASILNPPSGLDVDWLLTVNEGVSAGSYRLTQCIEQDNWVAKWAVAVE